MQNIVLSRFAALMLVTATVFGAVSPALAAPGVPVNLDIVGGKYTNDTTPTFTWTPGSSATWYEVLLDNGNWTSIGNVSSHTLSTVQNGWHTFYVRSHDNLGDISVSAGLTFEIDTIGSTIPAPTPSTAKTNTPTVFSVKPFGESIATYCWLFIDGKQDGQMFGVGFSTADAPILGRSVTFATTGTHTMYARCLDRDENYANGAVQSVVVSKGISSEYFGDTPLMNAPVSHGSVVIAACGARAGVGDSCHTVYYVGNDGKKHSFPSESVYFTWFSSYANMVTVSKSTLASIPTGGAVTHRPGTVLVKFPNSTTVYAVADGQVLRPIMNEAAAKAIYGSKWNNYVVTISEAFKPNYTFGSKIYSSGDYSKSQEFYGTKTIDQNWK